MTNLYADFSKVWTLRFSSTLGMYIMGRGGVCSFNP